MKSLMAKLFLLPQATWKFIKNRWKLLLFLSVLIAGGGYWQYGRIKSSQTELNFVSPTQGEIVKTLEISGAVDAKEKARLKFLAGGKVVYLGAKEGDWVKKWQTIASIDQIQLKKQLEQDLNAFMKERLDWDQSNEDIYRDGLFTKTEDRTLQKDQLDLTNEVLDVEIKTTVIRDASIYAPLAGVLTKSPATVAGVQLTATDYFEIVNPESLIFLGAIDEVDIGDVGVGQRANIYLDAYPDEPVPSEITYVSFSSSQSSTGTVFLAELKMPQVDNLQKYRLGMNGDVDIVLQEKANVMKIPLATTRERDDKTFVDVKTGDNTFEEREIKTGIETDEEVEVLEGLSLTDQVVLPE